VQPQQNAAEPLSSTQRDRMREIAEMRMIEQLPHIGAGASPNPVLSESDILRRAQLQRQKQLEDVEVEVMLRQQDRLLEREKEDKLSKAEMAELAEMRARQAITSYRRAESARGRQRGWNSSTDASRPINPIDAPLPILPAYSPKLNRRVAMM
jgi:hypothetical protein